MFFPARLPAVSVAVLSVVCVAGRFRTCAGGKTLAGGCIVRWLDALLGVVPSLVFFGDLNKDVLQTGPEGRYGQDSKAIGLGQVDHL